MQRKVSSDVVERQLDKQARKIAKVVDTTEEISEWRDTEYRRDTHRTSDNLLSLETRHENLVKQLNWFASEIVAKIPVKELREAVTELQECAKHQSIEISKTRLHQEYLEKRQDHVARSSANGDEVRFIKIEVESLSRELQKYTNLVKQVSAMMNARESSGESEHTAKLFVDLNNVRCEVERLAVIVDNQSTHCETKGGLALQSHLRRIDSLASRFSDIAVEVTKNSMEIKSLHDHVSQISARCDILSSHTQEAFLSLSKDIDLVVPRVATIESKLLDMGPGSSTVRSEELQNQSNAD